MTRHIPLTCAALLALPLALAIHNAHACSCAEPGPEMLSPSRLVKTPLNARVRVTVPSYLPGRLALRKHKGGEMTVKRVNSLLQESWRVFPARRALRQGAIKRARRCVYRLTHKNEVISTRNRFSRTRTNGERGSNIAS